MSLYNELTKRGYKRRIWTVLYPSSIAERESYGSDLAPFIAEPYDADPESYADKMAPTDPDRFNIEEIEKRKRLMVRRGSLFSSCSILISLMLKSIH